MGRTVGVFRPGTTAIIVAGIAGLTAGKMPAEPGGRTHQRDAARSTVAELPSSGEIRATVDIDVGACHVRVAAGGEKGDHRADFLG